MNIMRKNLLQILFFLTCLSMQVNAQMICTPTDFNDVTIMNPTGGTNTTNGLRTEISGAGNLQVMANNQYQMYSPNPLQGGSPNNTPGVNGIALVIGQDTYSTGSILNQIGVPSSHILVPTGSTCNTMGNTTEHSITFSITKNSLIYGLIVTYSYTYPNSFITVKYDVTIPPGNSESVKLSQAWDTYLAGGDYGPGFVSGTGSNLTMGIQKTVSGEVVYEAFKYKSGKAWNGYYSAVFNEINFNLQFNQYIFSNKIDTNPTTDNGIGISINYGSSAGTFSTTNDIIFKCNAPTSAPTFSSTSYTMTCGSPVNLKSQYTGTPEASLPAGVTLVFYDPSGNQVADPTAVSTPGTYNVFYSDANNAGCTSPSTTLTVTSGGCCSTAPSLSSNTITNTCPTETVNLNSLYSGSLPAGVTLEWYTNNTHTGTPVANPTAVATAGTYYAFVHDTSASCFSPASVAVTFTKTTCCLAGTAAPVIN